MEGLEYYFYDTVVEGYSSQDNAQVLAVMTAIMKQILDNFPEGNESIIGSDNYSCLASHESIPYIHKLNDIMKIICASK